MTAALEGGEWSAACPGRTLPQEKGWYPLYRRLGGPQGRSGRAENLVPTSIRSPIVQPVVSRYTDWPTHLKYELDIYIWKLWFVQRQGQNMFSSVSHPLIAGYSASYTMET